MEEVLESIHGLVIHDLAVVNDRVAFVRDDRAGDVAAKPFEGVPLMSSAARAGVEGESRELGDAGVVCRRFGRDSQKMGRTALAKVCDLVNVDRVVTDREPRSETRRAMEVADVELIVADRDA